MRKILHNLRASRETELAGEFPLHVVTRWLGNTPKIAMKHYLQVTEDDFARAAGKADADSESSTAKNAAPTPPPAERHPGDREPADPSGSQSDDPSRDPSQAGDRREQGAAECAAEAVQSAHAGDGQGLTAQSKTPVVTGVCANPDERSQPSSRDRNGGDRIRTCDLEVMSLASYRTAPPRVMGRVPPGHDARLPTNRTCRSLPTETCILAKNRLASRGCERRCPTFFGLSVRRLEKFPRLRPGRGSGHLVCKLLLRCSLRRFFIPSAGRGGIFGVLEANPPGRMVVRTALGGAPCIISAMMRR